MLKLRRLVRPAHARLLSLHSHSVPVIDMGGGEGPITQDQVEQVAEACSVWGFFHVINHGVDPVLMAKWDEQNRAFFDLPMRTKRAIKRSGSNARGFFDDELTKQKRDWKEALDFGVPGSRDWSLPDDDPVNAGLDGFNLFPPADLLPEFRPTMVAYFMAVTAVSERLTKVMALGLGADEDFFFSQLKDSHTSYLRLNYYPPNPAPAPPPPAEPPLGISPHRDAGFVTVLAQDMDCHSLQVRNKEGSSWMPVTPVEGAFTINTGDMAQMWSNNRYHAPEHRVLTSPSKKRYAAPFFYNPGYATLVKPLPNLGDPEYAACCWGYYRAQRFAGDFADYGTEIQTADFAIDSTSWHLPNQERFLQQANFAQAFSVEEYRHLLANPG